MKAIRLEEPGHFAQVNFEPASALRPDEAFGSGAPYWRLWH
jgi:hypothetical protein